MRSVKMEMMICAMCLITIADRFVVQDLVCSVQFIPNIVFSPAFLLQLSLDALNASTWRAGSDSLCVGTIQYTHGFPLLQGIVIVPGVFIGKLSRCHHVIQTLIRDV